MQKHERAALEAAQTEAQRHGLAVTTRHAHSKLLLVLSGPHGERHASVSNSPRERDRQTQYARQWVRRAAKEVA